MSKICHFFLDIMVVLNYYSYSYMEAIMDQVLLNHVEAVRLRMAEYRRLSFGYTDKKPSAPDTPLVAVPNKELAFR